MNRYRTVWVSDLHLGTKGANAEAWDGYGVLYLNSVATLKGLAQSDDAETVLYARANDYVDPARSMVVPLRRISKKEDSAAIR